MIDGTSKTQFLNFCLFHFSFHFTIVKNLMKKPSFLIMDFEGSDEFLLRHKCSWSPYFPQWNDGPFRFFRNLHGNGFYFFVFSKWNKYYSLTFYYTFKMQARINEKNSWWGYQLWNIVGHRGWPKKKMFHFKSSNRARKT